MNGNYEDYKLHLVGEQMSRDAIRHYRPEEFKARSYRPSRKMNNPKLSPSDIIKRAVIAASLAALIGGGVAAINNIPNADEIHQVQVVFAQDIPVHIANKKGVRVEVDSNGIATLVDENGRYGSLNNIPAEEYASMLGYSASANENSMRM